MTAHIPESWLKNYTFFRPLIKITFSVKPPLVPLSLKLFFFPLPLLTAQFTPFHCMFYFLSIPLTRMEDKRWCSCFLFHPLLSLWFPVPEAYSINICWINNAHWILRWCNPTISFTPNKGGLQSKSSYESRHKSDIAMPHWDVPL